MAQEGVKGRSGRGRSLRLAVVVVAGIVAAGVGATPALAAAPIVVHIDRAKLIHLPPGAATVVIGNPLIADVSVEPGGLAVITGKGYGETNVLVLNRDDVEMSAWILKVQGPSDPTVVVYRGTNRETYSCTPECLPRITLGDSADFFNKTLTQSTTRNNQAMTAAGKH